MCDMRVLISILYTTDKLQISLKIVCKICCMVSDNDYDVAVCYIKGRGDFSPPSDFGCTLYIQNLCLQIFYSSAFANLLFFRFCKSFILPLLQIFYSSAFVAVTAVVAMMCANCAACCCCNSAIFC